jgi:hypothetical protein
MSGLAAQGAVAALGGPVDRQQPLHGGWILAAPLRARRAAARWQDLQ